uniref:membrane-spanning 4-domains subfamily A member 4A-like n=1 Tax=Euleptes europaea TaxID=460621 RepID=UPI0025418EA1|nr:membrane-spanning 4-domains subfamily A member 4A-like [Euleptes europaea]
MDLRDPGTQESISKSIIRPSVPRPVKKLYKGEPMALGITQILIGILEFVFGLVIAVAEYNAFYTRQEHLKTPYWTGILYIISGSLSVAVARNPKIPLVKGMLTMNVVSTVAAGIGIFFLSISVAISRHREKCDLDYTMDIPPEICHEIITIPYTQMHHMSAVLLAFTILEFFITITTAAFGCANLCRNSFSETTAVFFQLTGQEAPSAVLTPVKEDEAP